MDIRDKYNEPEVPDSIFKDAQEVTASLLMLHSLKIENLWFMWSTKISYQQAWIWTLLMMITKYFYCC